MKSNGDFSIPAYIVGCPRSGTYLLAHLLNSRLPIAIPSETHFVPLFQRTLFLWGDLRKEKNRRRLLEAIFDFLEIWMKYSEKDRDLNKVRKFSLLSIDRRVREEISKKSNSYPALVTSLFKAYADRFNKSLAADKSAFYAHMPIERLQSSTPGLKVIHIIRDGRDVSLSWRKTWTGPITLAASAFVWSRHIRKKREWGRLNPGRYLEVRYEDLIENPDLEIAKIKRFLDIKGESFGSGLDFLEYAEMIADSKTHSMVSKPIDPTNKGKWRTEMSEKDRYCFESIAGHILKSCGYELTMKSKDASLRLNCLWRRMIYPLIEIWFLRHWMRVIKNNLPILIWLSGCFGIRLVRQKEGKEGVKS